MGGTPSDYGTAYTAGARGEILLGAGTAAEVTFHFDEIEPDTWVATHDAAGDFLCAWAAYGVTDKVSEDGFIVRYAPVEAP